MADSGGQTTGPERTKPHTRAKAPKSRRGCSRCKTRRIRCDESHPACLNCQNFGYQCPGFQRELRWSQKHERLLNTSSAEPRRDQSNEGQNVEFRRGEASRGTRADRESDCNASVFADFDSDLWLDPNNEWQDPVAAALDLEIVQAPVHQSTMLIEHWFRCICPMWSTFDSDVSYNRQLAWSKWGTSKTVFYTIQAMSAARLSLSTPQFWGIMLTLRSQAVAAIDEEIRLLRRSHSPKVKFDLVYAVFTLGNSSHCATSTAPEYPWLDSARELLSTWERESSASEASQHAYFCQALNYWEMLLAAVGGGSILKRMERKRRHYHVRLRQAMNLPDSDSNEASEPVSLNPEQSLLGTRPSSWSGVSSEIIDVFGQVLALCYNAYRLSKNKDGVTATLASDLLCDLSIAHELQRGLLDMDFETLVRMEETEGLDVQTGDANTPIAHLIQTAEAYRQAALLQLHLAFSDLEIKEISLSDTASDITNNRTKYLTALTLELVTTLEQIPMLSGSRSIHLMLYLSAATGLKFESFFESERSIHANSHLEAVDLLSDFTWNPSMLEVDPFSPDLTNFALPEITHNDTVDLTLGTDPLISESALEISEARDLVFTRLSSLQQTLPHRRMEDTLRFVTAIWKEYDGQQPHCYTIVYWLNFMNESGLSISLW